MPFTGYTLTCKAKGHRFRRMSDGRTLESHRFIKNRSMEMNLSNSRTVGTNDPRHLHRMQFSQVSRKLKFSSNCLGARKKRKV